MAKNIVTFGLKNVKYSKIDIKEGLLSYGPIKSLKGAQEITVDLIGGSTNVYGDDYTLATFNAYAGNTIALKMTEVTDEFKIDILGYELDEINKMVSNIDNNYYISWSFAKSYYEEVDFSELNNNATVYLFRFRNELKVSVIETGQFSYELSQDGPINSGSSVKINVMPVQSERTYRPVVYANNRRLSANDAGEIVIDNITEDIEITVELKELISIAPKENQQFIYSGLDQNLEYLVKDSLGEIIIIDSVSVNY